MLRVLERTDEHALGRLQRETIDPDGCTFWYANEYYDSQPTTLAQDNWKTEIGSFRLPGCNTAPAAGADDHVLLADERPRWDVGDDHGNGLHRRIVRDLQRCRGGVHVQLRHAAHRDRSVVGDDGPDRRDDARRNGVDRPVGLPTSGPIAVTTPGGTADTGASIFTVTAAPTITSFSPTSGPAGTTVTITGKGFTGATAVTFKGVPAFFTVVSDTQITATVPSGAKTGSIGVTTPVGSTTSATNFRVAPH